GPGALPGPRPYAAAGSGVALFLALFRQFQTWPRAGAFPPTRPRDGRRHAPKAPRDYKADRRFPAPRPRAGRSWRRSPPRRLPQPAFWPFLRARRAAAARCATWRGPPPGPRPLHRTDGRPNQSYRPEYPIRPSSRLTPAKGRRSARRPAAPAKTSTAIKTLLAPAFRRVLSVAAIAVTLPAIRLKAGGKPPRQGRLLVLGQQGGIAAGGRGVDRDHLLQRQAAQIIRAARLRPGARQRAAVASMREWMPRVSAVPLAAMSSSSASSSAARQRTTCSTGPNTSSLSSRAESSSTIVGATWLPRSGSRLSERNHTRSEEHTS